MLLLRRFLKDRDGSTAIEYSLIGVLIGIGIIAGVTQFTGAMGNTFDTVANKALGDGTLGK